MLYIKLMSNDKVKLPKWVRYVLIIVIIVYLITMATHIPDVFSGRFPKF